MENFDFNSEKITSDWLTEQLIRFGCLTFGSVTSVLQEESPVGAQSTASFYKITPEYSQDADGRKPISFLMKVAKPAATPDFENVASRFASYLLLPQNEKYEILEKEVVFYDALGAWDVPLPLLECYGTAIDKGSSSTCLLLEDLSSTHEQPPWPIPPTDAQCESTILALAKVHGFWWNHSLFGDPGFTQISPMLIDEVVSTYKDAFLEFDKLLGDRLSEPRRRIYQRVLNRLPDLLKSRMVRSTTLTLAHGDAHHWNVLSLTDNLSTQSILFDWQTWHIDTPAHDLAYLMAVCWFSEQREQLERPMLEAYLAELNQQGISYQWDDLWFDYRLSIIRHLFTPVIYSGWLLPAVWWPHLDRVFNAFEELDCADIL